MIKSLVTGIVLVYIRNSISILLVVHPSQVVLEVKNLPTNAGDAGLIPGVGGSPGVWNSNPLQYSCLENPMDRGAQRASPWGREEWDMTERLSTAHN